jgi:hypothetical protein
MILRCTQKFLTELRLKKTDLAVQPHAEHPLDEWYAHVFTLYPRRKCAIFMHATTMFCFFAYDKNREQLNDIKALFRKGLGRALFEEHYPASVIKLFNERLENIQIAPAQDRRVLGFINQRVQDAQFMADDDPEDRRGLDDVLMGLEARRSPVVIDKKGCCAIRRMRDLLRECSELNGVEISPVDLEHPDLEKFYKELLGRLNGAGYC